MEPAMALIMACKDRQTTHDSQESFNSETSDETMADMEARLREQLQQMRKRNATVEMEKTEAKARALLLEEQVRNLSSLLSDTARQLKEAKDLPKEVEPKYKLDAAPPGTLAAEVTRLQARVSEELDLRKTAQYDVIEKSKFICNLQSELVEKEAAISKLQMELTLLRSTSGASTSGAVDAPPSPSPDLRARRFSNPGPKTCSLSLPHSYGVDRATSPSVQKAPSFCPNFSPSPRTMEVTAVPKSAVSLSCGSLRVPISGSTSPALTPGLPPQGSGTNPVMTAPQLIQGNPVVSSQQPQQQAVRLFRESTSPAVRQYRTQFPGAASASLARPAARIVH